MRPVLTSSFLLGFVSLIGATALQASPAAAQSTWFKARSTQSSAAAVGGSTSVPYGWIDFCHRRPKECKVPALPAANVKLTARNLRILKRINQKANSAIKPVSNFDHWGTMADHWDYPVDGKGDCKIYALYKRKLLQEAGFPRQALLMTVVRDLNNEGHTILTVKTDKGRSRPRQYGRRNQALERDRLLLSETSVAAESECLAVSQPARRHAENLTDAAKRVI